MNKHLLQMKNRGREETASITQEPIEDTDTINHPTHYQSYLKGGKDMECIDAMEAAFGERAIADFCICNAFKYLWRHSSKNGMEDISKAIWYLNKYKELGIIELGD